MKGAATELIHAGEVERGDAVPLTTPIYETTTFVFDNARGGRRLQRRAIGQVPLFALREPDDRQRRGEAGGRSTAPRRRSSFSSGMGATATILMAHLKAGDEVVCSAAIYGGTLHLLQRSARAVRDRRRASSRSTSLRTWSAVFSDRTRLVWFESPINPTLRCVDIRRVAEACRARGVLSVIDNTFAQPDQPAAARARRRSGDAERDEVPERPQRRDRRRRHGREGAASAPIEKARRLARHGDGSASGVRARPRPEDAAAAHRAAQRERAGGRRVPGAAIARVSQVFYPGLPSHPDHDDRGAADVRLRRHGLLRSRRAATTAPSGSSIACRSSSAPPASAASRAWSACRC